MVSRFSHLAMMSLSAWISFMICLIHTNDGPSNVTFAVVSIGMIVDNVHQNNRNFGSIFIRL